MIPLYPQKERPWGSRCNSSSCLVSPPHIHTASPFSEQSPGHRGHAFPRKRTLQNLAHHKKKHCARRKKGNILSPPSTSAHLRKSAGHRPDLCKTLSKYGDGDRRKSIKPAVFACLPACPPVPSPNSIADETSPPPVDLSFICFD